MALALSISLSYYDCYSSLLLLGFIMTYLSWGDKSCRRCQIPDFGSDSDGGKLMASSRYMSKPKYSIDNQGISPDLWQFRKSCDMETRNIK